MIQGLNIHAHISGVSDLMQPYDAWILCKIKHIFTVSHVLGIVSKSFRDAWIHWI